MTASASTMELNILTGELERLYELEELKQLSESLLGLHPAQVGGVAAKASFARALAQRCAESEAVEALIDAMVVRHHDLDPRLLDLRSRGFAPREELESGESIGPYTILNKLGEGRLGVTYRARRDGSDVRLRVLWRETARDRKGMQRYFTHSRLAAALEHPGLPSAVHAGALDPAGERFGVSHTWVDGQLLSERGLAGGPLRFRDLKELLLAILEPLAALHDARLAHGALCWENVLRVADGRVLLLDGGSNHVRVRASLNGHDHRLATVGAAASVAPELIRGQAADARSDVYSFGALMYELASGSPLFGANTPLDSLIGHLSREPEPLSKVAPGAWVTPEIDTWVATLLSKDPARRPAHARDLIKALSALGRQSSTEIAPVSEDELLERVQALAGNPWDDAEAAALEAMADEGADPVDVAQGFTWVAEQLQNEDGPAVQQARRKMLLRAARVYEYVADRLELAERTYAQVLELEPGDLEAERGLQRVRKQLGNHEAVLEQLLAQAEEAESGRAKAEIYARIAKLCASELGDKDQALVAYTQAFNEWPENGAYADEIERLAGSRPDAWEEVLGACMEAAEAAEPEDQHRLYVRMGRWYADKLARPDLAVQGLSAVLASDPEHEGALTALSHVYRKSQQWAELGALLLRRAELAPPNVARDLKAEAAEVAENQLGNPAGARDLYEAVLADDPGHPAASEGLLRLCERSGDFARLARLLEQRAEGSTGEERYRSLCRAAAVHEEQLRDLDAAIQRYQAVLAEAPQHLEALRGLDRVYTKAQRFTELSQVLDAQLRLATTPRQQIQIHERIAALCEEEFLDFGRAAEAQNRILELDPDNDGALTALARLHRMASRWEDVVRVQDMHLQRLSDPERRVEKLLAQGRVLAEQLNQPERAAKAYEEALELSPNNLAALEALAKLRTNSGDIDRALLALDALAERAPTPEARAEQYVKAARFLDTIGRPDAAIERYKAAVDANPQDRALAKQLREAYLAHGDVSAAVELLERELARTEVSLARAKLSGELSRLCQDHLKDDTRAASFAKRALELDPTNLDALTVLGQQAYSTGHHREAVHYWDQVVNHLDPTERKDALQIFASYVDALAKSGNKDKALWACDLLGKFATNEPSVLARVAAVTFEFGTARRAFELYRTLVNEHQEQLSQKELAVAYYRLGESARRENELDLAHDQLERAIEIDPGLAEPYESLAKVYEERGEWHQAIRVLHHQLDLAPAEKRADIMIHIGELAATKLRDSDYGAKSYLSALSERPDDRKILMKLMQLYSAERDWRQLISVVLRLAELCEDPKQKAKYLHTAGMIAHREMKDPRSAVGFFDQALSQDPELENAAVEAIKLRRELRDFDGVKELLKIRIKQASAREDQALLLECLNELSEVYLKHLAKVDQAIAVLESAQEIEPENEARRNALAQLYLSHPAEYFEKAERVISASVRREPYNPQRYKQLRQLYTEVRRADGAWLACQALTVLGKASGDETRFYERMRSEAAAPAQAVLSDRDWVELLMPPETEPLLSSVFALIQPSVVAARARRLEDYGYGSGHEIDPLEYPYGTIYALHYAAQVLGIERPSLYQDPSNPGGLSFLNTEPPSVLLGQLALREDVPPQASAFLAARHLTFYHRGLYVRQLLPNVTMLKAWLFAAIKLLKPQFPITPDVEIPAQEAYSVLERSLTGEQRDHLAHVVSKLTQQGTALDLKKWVAAVDRSADRAGLLLCHDLETAVELIRASGDGASSVGMDDRLKDVIAFSVSPEYMQLRQQLAIAVDS